MATQLPYVWLYLRELHVNVYGSAGHTPNRVLTHWDTAHFLESPPKIPHPCNSSVRHGRDCGPVRHQPRPCRGPFTVVHAMGENYKKNLDYARLEIDLLKYFMIYIIGRGFLSTLGTISSKATLITYHQQTTFHDRRASNVKEETIYIYSQNQNLQNGTADETSDTE